MATAPALQLPDVEAMSAEDVLRWAHEHFGPSVNLGNIPPDEVIPLETLRLGLRGDTLKEVLLGDRAGAPAS